MHIVGCDRALTTYRKDRQFSVVFKNGGLDARQVKVSLLPAHNHELTEIQLGLFQIFIVQLPVIHEDGGGAVEVFACSRKFIRNDTQ